MANFVTEDDKRIRDLQQEISPFASDFLAIDRPGWTAAKRMTVQQIINMAAESSPFIKAYANTNNPDDAFGNNGDLFFTIPSNGSSLKLSQKISDVWATVFVLPLSSDPATVTFSGATGSVVVDFTINNRQSLFPFPHFEVWTVDGSTETLVNGYGVIKSKTSGLITSITLEGVFGSGYILIY